MAAMSDTKQHDDLAENAAEVYRVEEQIGFLLRRAHQRASLIFETVMGEFGMTPMQFSTLIKLQDLRQASQNELGRAVAMDPATTFGVVNRLKKQGLVKQRRDPRDARRLLLTLTAKGERLSHDMRAVARDVSARTLAPLAKEEANRLVALLGKIC
jgi:DNA-binding MarR family transcriptional regulator